MATLNNGATLLTAADGTDPTVTAGNAESGWENVGMSSGDFPFVFADGELTRTLAAQDPCAGPLPRCRLKVWTGTEWRELDATVHV